MQGTTDRVTSSGWSPGGASPPPAGSGRPHAPVPSWSTCRPDTCTSARRTSIGCSVPPLAHAPAAAPPARRLAAEETVTLGAEAPADLEPPILGPLRSASQIERPSATPSPSVRRRPLRLSGASPAAPGGYVLVPGPRRDERASSGRPCVHMGPADAEHYGVRHKDMMRLRVGGPAGLVFGASGARGPVVPPRGPRYGHRRAS
jgi:hypothetical protein